MIFAAGQGIRLRPYTLHKTKGLVTVNGESLIQRQVTICKKLGIKDIVVIVGFKAEKVRKRLGKTVMYAHNPIYKTTNQVYSLWSAREFCKDRDVIMLMADVHFHSKVLEMLLKDKRENVVLFDSEAPLDIEATKVMLKNRYVFRVDKTIAEKDAIGEYLGIHKFGKKLVNYLFKYLKSNISRDSVKRSKNMFTPILGKFKINALDIKGYSWIEIDFPWDLKKARKLGVKSK